MGKNNIIIGIDLGTTNSLAAYINNGKPEIIINERGNRITPSVVNFKKDDSVLIGELAKNQQIVNSEATITNIKTNMGQDIQFPIGERSYTPVELSALILRKIKIYSEKYLGIPIKNAVITVPAYFNDNQRQATLKAGILAGFNVLKLLNEPIAAALAYGVGRKLDEHILIFDLGGGTLDITLMDYKKNLFRVLATGGSTSIGGINFDKALSDFVLHEFQKQYSINLKEDPIAYQQILIHAEKAKIDLSSVEETRIFIPYITATEKGPIHLDVTITRNKFESIINEYLKSTEKLIEETFNQFKLNSSWINSIIFAGGSTRIPSVERTVVSTIKRLNGKGKINVYHDINPDEVVAEGAAILAGILSGELEEIEFYDITSHDLGIEDNNGSFITIIPKGTSYPCENVKLFTTAEDNQEEVIIHVLQSGVNGNEREYVSLGKFRLSNIAHAKAGEPNIDVRFSIDRHEIMNVSAVNLDTGTIKKVSISGKDWLLTGDFRERRGRGLKII